MLFCLLGLKMSKLETDNVINDNNVTMRDMKIFNEIRNYVRRKINSFIQYYYDTCPQKKEIYEFIQRCIETRVSNSVIVCGPPGSGEVAVNIIIFFLNSISKSFIIM